MPEDKVLPPAPSTAPPSYCPFMPPVIVPSKLQGSIDVRPIPCLGPRDPFKGGGCAIYKACQEGPERIIKALYALEETLDKAKSV